MIAAFEAANDATVVILPAGDAGQALVRAILEKGNPSADLLYGIDNTFLSRALGENLFTPYRPDLIDSVPRLRQPVVPVLLARADLGSVEQVGILGQVGHHLAETLDRLHSAGPVFFLHP